MPYTHHGRFHVSRHALGQNVRGSLGRGGVEYEVFDSGEKPSRLVFVSRDEEEAIAEARRLNAGGVPRDPPVPCEVCGAPSSVSVGGPGDPGWRGCAACVRLNDTEKRRISAAETPVPPGKARCSVCGKVGSKSLLRKHERGCKGIRHLDAKSGVCLSCKSGPANPAEKEIAKVIEQERKGTPDDEAHDSGVRLNAAEKDIAARIADERKKRGR